MHNSCPDHYTLHAKRFQSAIAVDEMPRPMHIGVPPARTRGSRLKRRPSDTMLDDGALGENSDDCVVLLASGVNSSPIHGRNKQVRPQHEY